MTYRVHRTFRTCRGLTLLHSLLLPALLMGLSGAVAAGPWHAAEQNTSGWYYMTPDERIEHQRRMRSFATYEECKAYQTIHHAQMATCARQQGSSCGPGRSPAVNSCGGGANSSDLAPRDEVAHPAHRTGAGFKPAAGGGVVGLSRGADSVA